MKRISLCPKFRRDLLDRFLRYVQVHTTSNDDILEDQGPSTLCQFDLADMLKRELENIGASDVYMSDRGYVYATLPSNLPPGHAPVSVIGLMSHLDTAPAAPGDQVKPRVFKNYDGTDITYPDNSDLVLNVADNPMLRSCLGHTLVTASGQTLLGADDKAGIAIIMTVLDRLIQGDIPHGEIRVCFNPDEEIGRGTKGIDLTRFATKIAYTVDAGQLGEVENECFNAAQATVTIKGQDIHPGEAYGKMVDAAHIMATIVSRLPANHLPQTTRDRQPYRFAHKYVTMTTGEAEVQFLLRAFTESEFAQMEEGLRALCKQAQEENPKAVITVTVKPFYRNMVEKLNQKPLVMDMLMRACAVLDITPFNKPIRGGTDGAMLTLEHDIMTPNLWSGAMNIHSRLEWTSLEWMALAAETIIVTLGLWVEHAESSQSEATR